MMDVADPLGLSRSGITRLIERLEAAWWVRREMAPDDRRGVVAILTPAGRGLARPAGPLCAATIANVFTGPLSQNDRAALQRACQHILVATS